MSTVHLLRSPTGGSARKQADAQVIHRRFAELGHEVIDLTGPTAIDSSRALRDAIEIGSVDRVVAAGGDGLVHLAVQELAQTGIPLAMIPSGTGNDFAAALGLSDGDASTALADPTPVDLLRIEAEDGVIRWVASVAILGFPAAINDRANRISIPLGSAVYTVAAALELPAFSRTVIDLLVDDVPVSSDSAMLAIGNTRFFGGGMLACPDARGDDGLAHLTSIEGVGRLGILRHLAQKSGGSADRPEVRRATATTFEIRTAGLDLWGDGDPVATTPLAIRVIPEALAVAGARP